MNDNTKKGNTVLLTIIAVATLLVAVVGATFAYFTASVKTDGDPQSVIVKTATIGTITYKDGDVINLQNALPGDSDSKDFTIESGEGSTQNVNYSIEWDSVDFKNEFSSTVENVPELYYSLTCTGSNKPATKEMTPVPESAGPIATGTLGPGESQTCTLKVLFRETGSTQDSNQGKSFTGKIKVTTGDSAYYNNSNTSGTNTQPSSQALE